MQLNKKGEKGKGKKGMGKEWTKLRKRDGNGGSTGVRLLQGRGEGQSKWKGRDRGGCVGILIIILIIF